MTNVAIQDVPAASSAAADQVLGVKGGVAKLFTIGTLALQWVATIGTSPVAVSLQAKIQNTMGVSILDYGADPTNVADSYTAIQRAIDSGAYRVHIPLGSYRCNSQINVDKNIELYGDGRMGSIINSYVTGANHGMVIIGDSALAKNNCIRLKGFQLNYNGSGQTVAASGNNNWSGLYVQRKVIADEIYINGFTNDGIYFAPSDAVEGATTTVGTIGNAVFFSEWRNVWSKNNGRDGIVIRGGANANLFINCDASANKGVGIHHTSADGHGGTMGTYGNTIIAGQASYNSSYGYYLESGTNLTTIGLYAEDNFSATNTNTDGYGGAGAPTPIDFYIGDNLSRSTIGIGTLYNNSTTHVRAPSIGLNDGIVVYVGGDRHFGSTAYHVPHKTATVIANSTATTVAGVVSDLNALIAALHSANAVS